MEQKKIFDNIRKLTAYGILTGLVPEEDKIYTINRLLELFHLQEIDDRTGTACFGIHASHDHPWDPRLHDRPGTHLAGFQGHIKSAALQPPVF